MLVVKKINIYKAQTDKYTKYTSIQRGMERLWHRVKPQFNFRCELRWSESFSSQLKNRINLFYSRIRPEVMKEQDKKEKKKKQNEEKKKNFFPLITQAVPPVGMTMWCKVKGETNDDKILFFMCRQTKLSYNRLSESQVSITQPRPVYIQSIWVTVCFIGDWLWLIRYILGGIISHQLSSASFTVAAHDETQQEIDKYIFNIALTSKVPVAFVLVIKVLCCDFSSHSVMLAVMSHWEILNGKHLILLINWGFRPITDFHSHFFLWLREICRTC